MVDLKELGARALQVAELAKERDAAFKKERAASIVLVDKVVESVAPALPALCSRIEETRDTDSDGSPKVTFLKNKAPRKGEQPTYRGVLLFEEVNWKVFERCSVHRRFYLLDSPTQGHLPWDDNVYWMIQAIAVDDYSGAMSTTEFTCVNTTEFLMEIGRKLKAEQVVEKISSLIDAQLNGDIAKRTKEANVRAERMQAIATLMAPPPKGGRK